MEPGHTSAVAPGDRLKGRFLVEKELGRGSGGVVYLARDTVLDRPVAIKVLSPAADGEALARFAQEARAAGSLEHPNVLVVHDVGAERDSPFIVSELLSGRTLRARLEQGPLFPQEALQVALQLARGLAATHQRGIVHRDLKPSNLFLLDDGRLKILDFGVAKLLPRSTAAPDPAAAGGPRTATGAFVGTVPYMSPEQVRGQPADARSDVFAFGAILHEMLSGAPPFQGPSDVEIGHSILNDDPPPPPETAPQPLRAIVRRCLAKKPEDRFQSAAGLLAALEELVVRPAPPPLFTRRRIVALALPLAVIGAVYLYREWRPKPAPGPRRLAVLPFHSIGGGPDGEAFSAGLGEILTNRLHQIEHLQPSLNVISAADIARERVGSARDARSAFGASLVLSGTLEWMSGRIAVTANLVDTGSQLILESCDFEVPHDDVRGVGRILVGKVARMLELKAPSPSQGGADDAFAASPQAARLYVEGRGYLQRYDRLENVDHALEAFTGALEVDPQFALAHAGMAEAWLRRDLIIRDPSALEQARTSIARAVASGPDLAEVVRTAGLVQLATGDSGGAIQSFQRALQLAPVNPDALRDLANAYDAAGKTAEAEDTFLQAVRLRPDTWSATRALGVFYNRHGRLQDALTQFQRVLAMTPDSDAAWANLGGIYLRLGRNPEAAAALEKSIALHPTGPAYVNLGGVHYFQGRFREAADAYRKAAQLTPADERVWGALADALSRVAGNEDEAAGAYRQALALAEKQAALNPNNAELHSRMALYHAYVGDRAEADAELQAALRLDPEDGTVQFRAALLHEQFGRRPRALAAIAKALKAGYSREEIENAPGLETLRRDPSYRGIRPGKR